MSLKERNVLLRLSELYIKGLQCIYRWTDKNDLQYQKGKKKHKSWIKLSLSGMCIDKQYISFIQTKDRIKYLPKFIQPKS